MKIGCYVSVVAGQKGFEDNVSGHIQIPLQAMKLLIEAGHECHLITTEFDESRTMPNCLPDGLTVHTVIDSRRRGGVVTRTSSEGSGVSLLTLLKQVREIKQICKEANLDVLHFYGYNRTAQLAGGLRLLGFRIPVVVTLFAANLPEKISLFSKYLWSKLDAIVTATDYVKSQLEQRGLSVTQVRHGIVRDIANEFDGSAIEPRHRVLFWRDLTIPNGADIALGAFIALADQYPEVQFDIAVRRHWDEMKDVEQQIESFKNVSLYRFPYAEGVSIPKLLMESICVVMPIRDVSIDPQLVIAESLAMGVPVVATNLRSNPEFVIENETGKLIELDDPQGAISALDHLLSNREQAKKMGTNAKEFIENNWNWNHYVNEITDIYRLIFKA